MLIDPFHRGLPNLEEERDNRHEFPGYGSSIRCWIKTRDYSDRSLDRYDPFAAASSQGRPSPGAWLRDIHGIARADEAGRCWLDGARSAFVGEAWGGPNLWSGEDGGGGEWLRADKAFLLDFLGKTDLVLAGYVKARMHRSDKGRKADDRMVHRTFGFLINSTGHVTVIKQVPKAIRHAVEQLGRYGKYDFSRRFAAIMRHLEGR